MDTWTVEPAGSSLMIDPEINYKMTTVRPLYVNLLWKYV